MSSSPDAGAPVDPDTLRAANLAQLLRLPTDPRSPRGIRHPLQTVLVLAVAGVGAGCRSFTAIAEHAQDTGEEVLRLVGLPGKIPSEPTFRRVLEALDPDLLSALFGAWMSVRVRQDGEQVVVALDGKTVRGAKNGPNGAPHLVAALEHNSGAVLGQLQVDAKTNEIPCARSLLELLDLDGVVVTMDAMHTQRETADLITGGGGDYVLTVKDNQPTLKQSLARLPWRDVPGRSYTERGHGRTITRTVKALVKPAMVEFPGCQQVLQVRRTTTRKGKRTVEVVYLICSRPMGNAQPLQVAQWVQGHWSVEVRLHWVRDVTFDEDRSQVRTGTGPAVMAVLRNIAITILRHLGWDNMAAATRHHSRSPGRVAKLLLAS
jgi:predicted transposase YbfD/YdcC